MKKIMLKKKIHRDLMLNCKFHDFNYLDMLFDYTAVKNCWSTPLCIRMTEDTVLWVKKTPSQMNSTFPAVLSSITHFIYITSD